MNIQYKCLNCNELFSTNNKKRKFCSQTCAAIYSNTHRERITNISTSLCLKCKTPIKYYPSTKQGKFCSNRCQCDYIFETQTIPAAERNEKLSMSTLKRVIIHLKGYKCESCNIEKWNDKNIALHLDHIDGNADNNNLINLRLLCPNCHSQTDTYCARNKKNTRRSIYNQRYRLKHIHNIP